MYIGYCKDVKYSYTRVGGKVPFEPELGENGEIIFNWTRLYNAGVEIHAKLPRECYVGSVTLPLLPKAKVCGIELISGGTTVGTFSAGTGKAVGGRITVNAGVFTDELTVRIETGINEVSFTEPEISVCYDDGAPILWPTPKSAKFKDGCVKISKITGCGEDAEFCADFLKELISERFGDVICSCGVPVALVISDDEAYKNERYTVSVREDGIELFGFESERELSSFKMLTSVSGVGPKAAMSILSLLTPEKFALAVCTEDKKTISKANGVGPKTAARIILELHDKLMKETSIDEDLSAAMLDHSAEAAGAPARGKLSEAMDALMVLGYTRAEAQNVLKSIDTQALSIEDIIRESLKKLSSGKL